MNTSRSFTRISREKNELTATRLRFISLPAPRPSSSPMFFFALLKRSRSGCRRRSRHLPAEPSTGSRLSRGKKEPLGELGGVMMLVATVSRSRFFSRLFKGLYPLWGRQIPYTMMKFASFETIVDAIYGYLPGQKTDYGKGAQMGVSFLGGYMAGILCAIVSHPADVMVSKLNATRRPGEAFGAAMSRIYKDIGFPGLWNGLIIRIFMIGTLTSLREYLMGRGRLAARVLTGKQNGGYTTALRSTWDFPPRGPILRRGSDDGGFGARVNFMNRMEIGYRYEGGGMLRGFQSGWGVGEGDRIHFVDEVGDAGNVSSCSCGGLGGRKNAGTPRGGSCTVIRSLPSPRKEKRERGMACVWAYAHHSITPPGCDGSSQLPGMYAHEPRRTRSCGQNAQLGSARATFVASPRDSNLIWLPPRSKYLCTLYAPPAPPWPSLPSLPCLPGLLSPLPFLSPLLSPPLRPLFCPMSSSANPKLFTELQRPDHLSRH